jgi:2-keto-4-pentenoate hydratase/2-oxohepta-3-ene-1,7-dioic acid hydratase in catechol pathway
MKLATLKNNTPVVVTTAGYVKLSDLGFDGSLDELVKQGEPVLDLLRSELSQKQSFSFIAGQFCAPLKHPSKIVAIGLNYVDHASESKMELPKTPLVFAKFPDSITGPYDKIIIPSDITRRVDYEVELGVIIGKKAKNVSKEEALNYVFGYTILNDVSARDLQFSDGQWVRSKSLDTFCPIGPVIVTADEIKDVQNLKLSCEVNGTILQDDTTANMIFGVADLISILSKSFTFEPGDIIATGTPGGVGFSRKPPIYLKHGDIVKTAVEGIGQLVNPVVEV